MKQRTESNFLAYLAENEISIFTLDQAKKFWIRNSTTNKSISRLIEKKRIIRLERGIYLYVPETAGPNRTWTENSDSKLALLTSMQLQRVEQERRQ